MQSDLFHPAAPAVPAARAAGTAGQPPLPVALGPALWRASELGAQATPTVATGWAEFDRELPGGGWPSRSVIEVLTPQPAVVEWRLLGAALARVVAGGGQLVVVAPPRQPCLPGLRQAGLDERRFVWVQAETPAERLWATEQLVKAGSAGAVVAWLPQARPEQIRRLQVGAQGAPGLVFVCRPEAAQHEASAAPLRIHASFAIDWALRVRVLKRRGPAAEGDLLLPSVPGALRALITPRLAVPSRLAGAVPTAAGRLPAGTAPLEDRDHAVGRAAVARRPRGRAGAH